MAMPFLPEAPQKWLRLENREEGHLFRVQESGEVKSKVAHFYLPHHNWFSARERKSKAV